MYDNVDDNVEEEDEKDDNGDVDLSSAQHTLVTTGWAGSITYI